MKGIIFLEMLGLYAGDVLVVSRTVDANNVAESGTVAIYRTWRHLIAVVILLALLLAMANAGFGGTAALLGGVIVLAWWVTAAGTLGPVILDSERRLFA